MLYVDTRWGGQAGGIQRFATEVVSRLQGEWRELPLRGNPYSPLDPVLPARLALSPRDTVYSPGYNAGLTRARQIVTIHDLIHLRHPSGGGRAKALFYERVLRPAVRRAGRVMTVSETSREAIVDWLRDPGVEVVNVGNGCSPVFSLTGPCFDHIRDYLLYVGAIRAHKNFDVLLGALALRPGYRLLVVSEDPEGVKQRAASAGVLHRVSVMSQVSDDELAALYRGSLGLVFPSLLEGFGLPAVEAMRCGKRVAYWEGCESLAEIVGETGPRVESPSSEEAWAQAMDDLARGEPLTEPELRTRAFDWDRVAERVRAELNAAA